MPKDENFIEYRENTNKKIREIKATIKEQRADIDANTNMHAKSFEWLTEFEEKLAKQTKRIDLILQRLDGFTGAGEPPTDKETLKAAVKANITDQRVYTYQESDKKAGCRVVRDWMVTTWPSTFANPGNMPEYGYVREPEAHSDAVYHRALDMIIDFCSESSNSGVVYDSITWNTTTVFPAGWRRNE